MDSSMNFKTKIREKMLRNSSQKSLQNSSKEFFAIPSKSFQEFLQEFSKILKF